MNKRQRKEFIKKRGIPDNLFRIWLDKQKRIMTEGFEETIAKRLSQDLLGKELASKDWLMITSLKK